MKQDVNHLVVLAVTVVIMNQLLLIEFATMRKQMDMWLLKDMLNFLTNEMILISRALIAFIKKRDL